MGHEVYINTHDHGLTFCSARECEMKRCDEGKQGEGQMCDRGFTVVYDQTLSTKVHVFAIKRFISVITPVGGP